MRIPAAPSAKLISTLVLLVGLTLCPCASAQFNPIQAAKDAYNKAKQQQQQKQQQGQQGQQQTQQPNQHQAGAPDNSASQPATSGQPAAQPASTPDQTSNPETQSASAGTAAQGGGAWKPPSDSGAAAAPAGSLDPSKLPDITGLHLGMSLAEAAALMKKWYPKGVGVMNGGPLGPQHQSAVAMLRGSGDSADTTVVEVTAPPNPQVVWSLSRDLNQPNVAHNVIVASLRQKYGKETYADYRTDPAGKPIIDDSQIRHMWWVFDEQGHLLPQAKIMQASPFGCGSFNNTGGSSTWSTYQKIMLGQDTGLSTYCMSSYVGVEALISLEPILKDVTLNIVDVPLMVRSAQATGAWAKGQDDKARQEELQREKQTKPQL